MRLKQSGRNMYITADILERFTRDLSDTKIVPPMGQSGLAQREFAKEFIKQDGNIKTLCFPAAAPEENPQEHMRKNGRSHAAHNLFIKDIDKTTDDFAEYLNNSAIPYGFAWL